MMTCIHLLFTSVGVQLCAWCGFYSPKKLTRDNVKTVVWFSVVFSVNIWLSNASLMAVSVNLHQVVRTTIPLFTMAMSITVFGDHYTYRLLPSILLVVFGVAATVWGDMEFDAFGMTIVVLGCVFSSLKGILTQKTQVGSMGMASMDLLRYLSPLAVLQLLALSAASGEISKLRVDENLNRMLFFHLFTLGCVAFGVNFVSFRNAALNNPLTLNIAGNIKQVLTSLLSIWLFGGTLAPALAFGILMTAVGAFWYSNEMQKWRLSQKQILASAQQQRDEDSPKVDIELAHTTSTQQSRQQHDDANERAPSKTVESVNGGDSPTRLTTPTAIPKSVMKGHQGRSVSTVASPPLDGSEYLTTMMEHGVEVRAWG